MFKLGKKKREVTTNASISANHPEMSTQIGGINATQGSGVVLDGIAPDSKGLVTAAESAPATPAPATQIQANGLTPEQVQAQIDATNQKAESLRLAAQSQNDLATKVGGIEAKSEAGKALVAKYTADIAAGACTDTFEQIVANCGLKDAENIQASRTAPSFSIAGAADSGTSKALVVEAACAMSFMSKMNVEAAYDERTLDMASKMGTMSLKAMANECMKLKDGTSAKELTLYSTPQDIMAAISSTNFSSITANIGNKMIGEQFDNNPAVQVIRAVTKMKPVNDFKTNSSVRLSSNGTFVKLAPGQDIPMGSLADHKYTNNADMYGRRMGLSFQDIVNDDLGMLDDMSNMMYNDGLNAYVDAFVQLLRLMGTNNFFSVAGNNLNQEGLTPSFDAYKTMNQLFSKQKQDNGRKTSVRAKTVLTPSSLIALAEQMKADTNTLMLSPNSSASKDKLVSGKNIYSGKYDPLELNFLDSDNTYGAAYPDGDEEWYGFADPNLIPAVVASYLNGVMAPTIFAPFTDMANLAEMYVGMFNFGFDQAMPQGAVKFAPAP